MEAPLPTIDMKTPSELLSSPLDPNSHSKVLNPELLNTEDNARLEGLRQLLEGWPQYASSITEEQERNLMKEKEAAQRRLARERLVQELDPSDEKQARDSLFIAYHAHATKEDDALVSRWTETVNILLTFAGLLSGVITAFLITEQEGLRSNPLSLTNILLKGILASLNSTGRPIPADDDIPIIHSTQDMNKRVSLLYHISLACSLTSAFGGLLSKQWIIHYTSQPRWADTLEEQCRLRRMRHQGLKTWGFYVMMEVISLLLQLSILLFAVGLAESLKSVDWLYWTITIIIIFNSAFYAITLFTGTFFPHCPFKSSLTDSLLECSCYLATLPVDFLLPFQDAIQRLMARIPGIRRFIPSGVKSVVWSSWNRFFYLVGKQEEFRRSLGEQYSELPQFTLGVFWWGLANNTDRPEVELEVASKELRALPARIFKTCFAGDERLFYWGLRTIEGMLEGGHASRGLRVAADALCYFIYHSPALGPLLLDTTKVARALRKTWADDEDETRFEVLPMTSMRKTTVAIYFRATLHQFDPLLPAFTSTLSKELSTVLKTDYFIGDDTLLDQSYDDITYAVMLSSAIVVDDSWSSLFEERVTIARRTSYGDRLCHALQKLSTFTPQAGHPHGDLASAAIDASRQVVKHVLVQKTKQTVVEDTFRRQRSQKVQHFWEDTAFEGALLALLQLGSSHWHGTKSVEGEESRVYRSVLDMFNLIRSAHVYELNSLEVPGVEVLATVEGMAGVLEVFAHPRMRTAFDIDAIRLLDYALGLRCQWLYQIDPTHPRYLLGPPQGLFTWNPMDPPHSIAPILKASLQQLIYLIRESENGALWDRDILFSVLVKGRDIFLPKFLLAKHPVPVRKHLQSQFKVARRSGDPLQVLSWNVTETINDQLHIVLPAMEEHVQHIEQRMVPAMEVNKGIFSVDGLSERDLEAQ